MIKEFFTKIGIIKPTPRLYYRLRNLLRYFEIVDIQSDRIVNIDKEFEDGSYANAVVNFKFYSKLGAVEVTLRRCECFDYYEIEYITYAGTELFTLKATDEHVYVEPCMGYEYNVKAEDIDLAILELEQYLENEYGNIEVLNEGFLTAQCLAEQSHEKQIEYLENL